MPSSKWTPKLIDQLKDLFPRATQEILQQAIPGISWVIIKRKAGELGIERDLSYVHKHLRKKGSYNEWSLVDLEDLQKMYKKFSKEHLSKRFSNRDYSEIKRKALSLGLKRDKQIAYTSRPHTREDGWSIDENNYLTELYQTEEFLEDVYRIFKERYPTRSSEALRSRIINKKIALLRRSPTKRREEWSNEDIIFLQENYIKLSWKELKLELDRPHRALQNKALSLGLKRPKELFWREGMWTKEELKELYKMWPDTQIEEIFDRFPDRKYDSLKRKAYEAGIKRLIKNSTSEILMKRLLDEIFPGEKVQDNERYDWLRSTITNSKMELDRYYPDLKLAFEYDGEQHYSADAFYRIAQTRGQNVTKEQAQKEFDHYVKNDKIKKDICEKLGIKLIVISFDEELSEELIRSKLKNKESE